MLMNQSKKRQPRLLTVLNSLSETVSSFPDLSLKCFNFLYCLDTLAYFFLGRTVLKSSSTLKPAVQHGFECRYVCEYAEVPLLLLSFPFSSSLPLPLLFPLVLPHSLSFTSTSSSSTSSSLTFSSSYCSFSSSYFF